MGESVVYVDDDSDTVHAKDPQVLRNLMEQEANNSAKWLKDNRLCVAGEKNKFMIIGTKQLRASKLTDEAKIVVDNKEIAETCSEKLLGVVINNELTWKNHLYGDKENDGLVQQLSKRIGMLKKISRYMSREKLKYFSSGIFYSKLSYCLPVFGNVLGLEEYKEDNSRYQSFTQKDNNSLQVLQNKLNRMILNADKHTPTQKLLEDTNTMSIQQMIVYQTALMSYKIVKSGKPDYLANQLVPRGDGMHLRGGMGSIHPCSKKLSISKEGFLYRGSCIMNKLDENLRNEPKLEKFKTGAKQWVKKNIKIKPSSKHPQLLHRNGAQPQPMPAPKPNPNDIRRFLTQQNQPHDPRPPPLPTQVPAQTLTQRSILRYLLPRPATTRNPENNE